MISKQYLHRKDWFMPRRIMIDSHVGRLPVIDGDELVGMMTSKDIMKAFINFRKNVPEKYQKTQIKEILVEEVMSDNPLSISKNALFPKWPTQ